MLATRPFVTQSRWASYGSDAIFHETAGAHGFWDRLRGCDRIRTLQARIRVLVDVCDAKRTAHGLDTNTLRNMTQPYHMSKPTEAGIARFTALLDELSGERDVVRASMFGMPGMKRRGGKAFCGLYGEDMIFKLEGEAHSQALSLEGAHLFEPMAGRPMKAWIQVPPEHESQYGDLARAAEAALGL